MSKWDKLLTEAVITHSEKPDVNRLQISIVYIFFQAYRFYYFLYILFFR